MKLKRILLAAAAASVLSGGAAVADSTGITDTSIKIGNTNPYSGPASAYSVIGKAISAYFKELNTQGGINGRTIEFISLDDGYSPPRTVQQVRKLVEKRKDRVPVPVARHANELGHSQVHEPKESAAAVCCNGRFQMGPARKVSLDDGLPAHL